MTRTPRPIGPLAIALRRTGAGRMQLIVAAAALGALLLAGIGLLIGQG